MDVVEFAPQAQCHPFAQIQACSAPRKLCLISAAVRVGKELCPQAQDAQPSQFTIVASQFLKTPVDETARWSIPRVEMQVWFAWVSKSGPTNVDNLAEQGRLTHPVPILLCFVQA